jgi:hypothetical protein
MAFALHPEAGARMKKQSGSVQEAEMRLFLMEMLFDESMLIPAQGDQPWLPVLHLELPSTAMVLL